MKREGDSTEEIKIRNLLRKFFSKAVMEAKEAENADEHLQQKGEFLSLLSYTFL